MSPIAGAAQEPPQFNPAYFANPTANPGQPGTPAGFPIASFGGNPGWPPNLSGMLTGFGQPSSSPLPDSQYQVGPANLPYVPVVYPGVPMQNFGDGYPPCSPYGFPMPGYSTAGCRPRGSALAAFAGGALGASFMTPMAFTLPFFLGPIGIPIGLGLAAIGGVGGAAAGYQMSKYSPFGGFGFGFF